MGRALVDAAVLFLAPFLVYGVGLAIRQRYPFVAESWSRGSLAVLTVVGLALVLLGMLALATFADRHQGAYVPAHIDHGRLQPGHME